MACGVEQQQINCMLESTTQKLSGGWPSEQQQVSFILEGATQNIMQGLTCMGCRTVRGKLYVGRCYTELYAGVDQWAVAQQQVSCMLEGATQNFMRGLTCGL